MAKPRVLPAASSATSSCGWRFPNSGSSTSFLPWCCLRPSVIPRDGRHVPCPPSLTHPYSPTGSDPAGAVPRCTGRSARTGCPDRSRPSDLTENKVHHGRGDLGTAAEGAQGKGLLLQEPHLRSGAAASSRNCSPATPGEAVPGLFSPAGRNI